MLAPSFRTKVGTQIQPGLVCLGHFDEDDHRGSSTAEGDDQKPRPATLAIATSGNRVLLHGPAGSDGARFLNLNRQVSALSCGRFDGENRDSLLVGSTSSLLAYDVHDNSDKFFVEIPEGVRSLRFGKLHGQKQSMVFVGGDCSLQGFDQAGTEQFWTVVGGCATSMIFADVDRDGKDELVVGSDDFEIRAFQNEQSLFEVTETESVLRLCPLETTEPHSSRFAYGLRNGTIGVYDGKTRVWRVKAKDDVQAIVAYDLDGDGVEEVVSGWSNGKLEARREEDGQVVYRETLGSSVSALFKGDFRGTGKDDLVCCTLDGEVRGYDGPGPDGVGAGAGGLGFDVGAGDTGMGGLAAGRYSGDEVMRALRGDFDASVGQDDDAEDDAILVSEFQGRAAGPRSAELAMLQEQLTLKTMELRSLEDSLQHVKAGDTQESVGALPAGAHVHIDLAQNARAGCLDLIVQATEGCLVHSVLVFAMDAGLFAEGECVSSMPAADAGQPGARLCVPLRPLKNIATTLRVQVMVSARGAAAFLHVFEVEQPLRKLSMFVPAAAASMENSENERQAASCGNVAFVLANASLAAARVVIAALLEEDALAGEVALNPGLELRLASLRDGAPLRIYASEEPKGVRMKIESTSLETLAEVVQAIAHGLEVSRLETCLDFPAVLRRLEELMTRVDELRGLRQRLNAEMADESNYIKGLIVRAEDARVLQDVTNLSSTYADLTSVNMQLIGEYNKRSNNQAELLATLREVNQIIQRASQVRVGPPQAAVVSACRKAIKSNSIPALFHAITSMTSA